MSHARTHRGKNLSTVPQVSLDELDGLQQELEAALSAVVVRSQLEMGFCVACLQIASFNYILGEEARAASGK